MRDGIVRQQRLGFGCVRLGSATGGNSWRSDVRLVRAAVDAGVQVFDTADAYGNGVSELVLGRALRGRRESVEVATKVGYVFTNRSLLAQSTIQRVRPIVRHLRRHPDGGHATPGGGSAYASQDFSPSYVRSAVEASLRRLQTEHIDVLQLHGPPVVMPQLLNELDDLVHAGKVRRWGVGAESIESACEWISTDSVGVVQLPFGVLDPDAAELAFPIARDVEMWVRGVFGGGVLADTAAGLITGSGSADHPVPGTHFKWPLITELFGLADRMGVSPFELAFDYVRSFASVSTIVLGMHSVGHLEENLRLMERPDPPPEVLGQLSEVISRWVGSREQH